MGNKTVLQRGFKTKAEQLAIEYREKLDIHPCNPLCAMKLADYLNVSIYKATEFLSSSSDVDLLAGKNGQECEWSALTMKTEAGNRIIIHNPYNSPARQQSDLMHELAHIICKHETQQANYNFAVPFGMRYFNEVQEEEAKWLGATLQIAKPGLFWARRRNLTLEEIASHFNASVEMVKFRINTTGLAKQYFK